VALAGEEIEEALANLSGGHFQRARSGNNRGRPHA
jgi:hypothetical protein